MSWPHFVPAASLSRSQSTNPSGLGGVALHEALPTVLDLPGTVDHAGTATGKTAVDIIYDGDCSVCQACIAWVQRHDPDHTMVVTPSAALSAEDVADLPVHRTVVVRTDHGGTLFRSQAVAAALGALPGGWGTVGRGATRLLAVALFRAVGDMAYDAVADHRSQISAFLVRRGVLDSSCQVTRP
jgi:predicted DCC family thiol-disulfide oxidoreductase YuxK